jgi:hypothetical protein
MLTGWFGGKRDVLISLFILLAGVDECSPSPCPY